MKKAIIITSYFENFLNIKEYIRPGDYVICTDGGYDIAKRQNIEPDLLMGDFDSIALQPPKHLKIKRFRPEKDFTDLELALKTAVEMKCSETEIFGGIGGRLDHTVANLQLLSHYSDSFDRLVILDAKNKCFVLNERQKHGLVIPAEKDCYLSLFSLSETCLGVTIQGVKYPLQDHTLTRDFPLGVSNEFNEKNAVLSIKSGVLLVVISKE